MDCYLHGSAVPEILYAVTEWLWIRLRRVDGGYWLKLP